MVVETKAPVISIERMRPGHVVRLDIEERAEIIALEEGEIPGIPVFVRTCESCEMPDLSEWFLAPDRDLGAGWVCSDCGLEDRYQWTETSLSRVRG